MPTYDFFCQQCNKTFEVRLRLDQYKKGPQPKCPQCRSRKVVRSFVPFNVIGSRGGTGAPFGGCGPSSGPGCCG